MLYLLPNLLADLEHHAAYLPASVDAAVATLTDLIAENEKEGRRFLRRFQYEAPKTFRDIKIHLLNEHSTPSDKQGLISLMGKGGIWGLVSDCGMPCLADPGADLVLMARNKGIPVSTFAGPSSILMALVLSGLGGQRFTFHGYLPKEEPALVAEIKRIEKLSQKEVSTHLWIETPYRNQRLFQCLLFSLQESSWLCLACNLTEADQLVETKQIKAWKQAPELVIGKRPCIFVLNAESH
jgi:16S rRNA (cytidine1402-2'-O)-methyltransferase